ncbi:MAG TPA: hypothetical protein VMD77_09235 [Candidatus Baltobacteraceae bacterium]|nr:hypothetical protein [Candidatus Baltobacteraceae bacterium]
MKSIAKRLWPLALVLPALLIAVTIVRHRLARREQKKRQAVYELTLRSYQEALKPGMTRKEVEDYLRAKNANIRQMCCINPLEDATRSSWDDLVKIGREDVPWFCSENNVYVAFQFADHEHRHDYEIRDSDLDTLRAVTIYRQLEGCL